jgi:hypothetical protein
MNDTAAITSSPPPFALGPTPVGEHAEALAAEQARLAQLVAVRQRYASVLDGDALLCAALIGGWPTQRLEEELRIAAGELVDDQVVPEPPAVCSLRPSCKGSWQRGRFHISRSSRR